ncbi:MAG: type II toxin-antitoxin system HicB family antitoxin [Planctomycetia bacterium]|nr:type II toxin-antitoxin system HicB family antitoxin [Planctomycetia bacterium]
METPKTQCGPQSGVYECRVLLCEETGGGYSAHALRLPGVVSEGETVDDALRNIGEAFREALLAYKGAGAEVPWEDVEVDSQGLKTTERWIRVDV